MAGSCITGLPTKALAEAAVLAQLAGTASAHTVQRQKQMREYYYFQFFHKRSWYDFWQSSSNVPYLLNRYHLLNNFSPCIVTASANTMGKQLEFKLLKHFYQNQVQGVPHQYGLNQYEFHQYAFSKSNPEIQLVRFCIKNLHLYDFNLYDFESKSPTCTNSTNMNCCQSSPTCTISTMYTSLKLMYRILQGNARTC